MPRKEHTITVTCEGRKLRTPQSYSVDLDVLQPADAFSLTFPFNLATWKACPLDGEVQINIDDAQVLNGFIETLQDNGNGTFTASGGDRTIRLVQESIPGAGASVANRQLGDVVASLAWPWFRSVTFSNAANRALRLGRGRQPKTSREPALTSAERLATVQRIEAGVTRWEAIQRLLRPLQCLAWGTADGRQLVIARPQYDQAPLFELFETIHDGTNVLSMRLGKSNANRYAQIEVSGSGLPPGFSPPPRPPSYPGEKVPPYVARNKIGVAFDGPAADGTGGDFLRPKRLFVVSEALSTEEAQIEAERIQARGLAQARTVEVTVPGHGQRLDGSPYTTLYTPDTVSTIIKEVESAPGDDRPAEVVNAPYYCTRVNFQGSQDTEETQLSFVPLGTLLI